mmetsp:Transcript_16026/g.20986  ORF Transcript_16026/g.20986 Transcript_16026/m.20986 type:complete len:496 (+) Transcript_16026:111-1598(+)
MSDIKVCFKRRTFTLFFVLGCMTSVLVKGFYPATVIKRNVALKHIFNGLQQTAFSDESEANMKKWEKMYFGEKGDKEISRNFGNEVEPNTSESRINSEVKVITFDLDDTLWKTSAVIDGANTALQEYLDSKGIKQPRQIKDVMKEMFLADKGRYCPEIRSNPKAKAEPVLFTLLRKDAIADVCINDNGFSETDAKNFAEESFEVWTNARHGAIPENLATSVVDCLSKIRSLRTSSNDPIVVGAITNGNSDPRRVPILAEYFDFCINSEDVGFAKPSSKIYEAAVDVASSFPATSDIFSHMKIYDSMDSMMDLVGPWWIHVGDDFFKDVVAAKELGMRTIWARELVLSEDEKRAITPVTGSKERTVEDLVSDMSKEKVVVMEIGSRDYLEESIRDDFADSTITKFEILSEIVSLWQREGMSNEDANIENIEGSVALQTAEDFYDVTLPDEPQVIEGDGQKLETQKEQEHKFCMFCGTKLPVVAKFCSSCGASQIIE